MKLHFSKYHGSGNDFIMVDNRTGDPAIREALQPDAIRRLCTRHLGIGADGLIVALKTGDDEIPYEMGYFNADGSPAEMCGNGIRCLMVFLDDLGEPVREMEETAILTGAGPVRCRFSGEDTIQVIMPTPSFNPQEAKIIADGSTVQTSVTVPGLREQVIGTAVGVGNPHFVIYNNEMWEGEEVHAIGSRVEIHKDVFPEGVNVGFARRESQYTVSLVVWERGVGPTLACGSGAVAAVAAGIAENRFPFDRKIKVRMPGGELGVTIGKDWSYAVLEGKAIRVFEGTVTL